MRIPDDYMNELRPCPVCNKEVAYGDLIWFNGKATCESCYIKRRRRANLDKEMSKRYRVEYGEDDYD